MICGAESWDDIELFGESKLDFLRTFLPFKNGIPSDDTLRRFFRAIDHHEFQRLFIEWIRAWLNPEVANKVIAIDGKTLRGSHDGDKSAIHLVSAFASEANIVLGQVKTSEKSNEITAIPELLNWLDVRGAMVTIDAMGWKKDITKKIAEKGGDYFIALKGNQDTLFEDVKLYFEQPTVNAKKTMQIAETLDKGHGRIEIRRCRLSFDVKWLQERHANWKNLNCIVAIDSERHLGESVSHETRVSSAAKQASVRWKRWPPFVSIGALKTSCIGCWICHLAKIKAEFASTMRPLM